MDKNELIWAIVPSIIISLLGITLLAAAFEVNGAIGAIISICGIAMIATSGFLFYDAIHNEKEKSKDSALYEIETIAKSEEGIAWERVKDILNETGYNGKTDT